MAAKEVKLPSGAMLVITLAPFQDGKALYQAVCEELINLQIRDDQEIAANLIKDLFCRGFSSKKIEAALAKCLTRVSYNGVKVTDDIWEPEEARQDYLQVCIEVLKENLRPFVKSLSAEFSTVFPTILGDLARRQATTPA